MLLAFKSGKWWGGHLEEQALPPHQDVSMAVRGHGRNLSLPQLSAATERLAGWMGCGEMQRI